MRAEKRFPVAVQPRSTWLGAGRSAASVSNAAESEMSATENAIWSAEERREFFFFIFEGDVGLGGVIRGRGGPKVPKNVVENALQLIQMRFVCSALLACAKLSSETAQFSYTVFQMIIIVAYNP